MPFRAVSSPALAVLRLILPLSLTWVVATGLVAALSAASRVGSTGEAAQQQCGDQGLLVHIVMSLCGVSITFIISCVAPLFVCQLDTV
jgi:hypothetical protein